MSTMLADFKNFVTVKEAAEIIGCTPDYVRQLKYDGQLEGQLLTGRCLLIDRQSAVAFSKRPKTTGRPKISERN